MSEALRLETKPPSFRVEQVYFLTYLNQLQLICS